MSIDSLVEFARRIHSNSPCSSDNAPRTVEGKDLNHRMVYVASEMGIGREDISVD